jgi:hypothetical protein
MMPEATMGLDAVEKRPSGMFRGMDLWKQGETEILSCTPAVRRTNGE